ncbi:hypothetical protein FRC08_017296 [Ceratobasidium sp. 394]|nr:hypothetical protein FRC08_017296 [Ceratobasidium sp. 394]
MVPDQPLNSELQDLIFCDPLFTKHFFVGDKKKQGAILQQCHRSVVYKKQSRWSIPRVGKEDQLYTPVISILNTIKGAVDIAMGRTSTNTFLNRAGQEISADCKLDPLTRPDLVLFDGAHEGHEHWETVRMTVSVKRLKSHLKAAITGLAFDARAVFTHQLHRRHLYALAICGTQATFVRFDRAGVLYSTPIDVCADSDRFTTAVAALLMMDDHAFGFDTAFTTRMNKNQRLEYYVDLPESASHDEPRTGARPASRRFKVVECLCNRGDIVGRATIVLRIKKLKKPEPKLEQAGLGAKTRGQKRAFEESQSEELHDESFVLKLVWRDPDRESEGEILEELVGIYGLVQYVWHCDVPRPCKCGRLASLQCATCVDETPQLENMLMCENLTNIQGAIHAGGRNGHKCREVITKRFKPTSETRERRIYSRILLSSIGKPLRKAGSPRELLMGMLDAIMGYWRLVNIGIIHRDISDGNVMLLPPAQTVYWREWKERPRGSSKRTSDSDLKLEAYLARFDRDPTGMLSDFDMYMQVSGNNKLPRSSKTEHKGLLRDAQGTTRKSRVGLSRETEKTREEHGRHAKRRKLAAGSYAPVTLAKAETARWRATSRGTESEEADYRVGTVAFMSVKVLNVRPGQEYEHTFLDDLESFFWVLLYIVAAHTDPGIDNLTPAASGIVDRMDHEDMHTVQMFKLAHLADCRRRPRKVTKMLSKIGNSWACDGDVVLALVQLGSFFFGVGGVSLSEQAPAKVFPRVVDVFIEALQNM